MILLFLFNIVEEKEGNEEILINLRKRDTRRMDGLFVLGPVSYLQGVNRWMGDQQREVEGRGRGGKGEEEGEKIGVPTPVAGWSHP